MDFNTKVLKVKIPSILPKEYKQLEYIQSSGNQYLTTNIIPNGNEHFKIEFMPLEFTTSVNYIICGARDNETYGLFVFGSIADTYGGGARLANFGVNQTISKPALNIKHIIEYNKEKMWYDGTQYIATGRSVKQIQERMVIFAGNTEGQGITGYTKMRLYSFIVYNEDGTIKESWTPAKRVSDNVIGMYDTITKTFFTNQGSGAFTGGSELTEVNVVKISKDSQVLWRGVPDEYQRLNYIESNGSQYINTKILGTNLYNFELDILPKATRTGTQSIYLSYISSSPEIDNFTLGTFQTPTGMFLRAQKNESYKNNGNIVSQFNRHIIKIDNNGLKVDNTILSTNIPKPLGIGETSADINLLGSNTGGELGGVPAQLFKAILYGNNNSVLRCFLPAKRLSDNVIGMYDIVSKTFFTNAGSGAFTGG